MIRRYTLVVVRLLVVLLAEGCISSSRAATTEALLSDTLIGLRLTNGSVERGRILFKDSIRTTLQSGSGEIKTYSNKDIEAVYILDVRTVAPDPFRLYATPSAALTTGGGGIGLALLLPNNWGFEFKYRSLSYRAARKPDNYDAGGHEENVCFWLIGCWTEYVYETTPDPHDHSEQYSISVHRKSGSATAQARVGWQAGLTFMETDYYEFQRKAVNGNYGSNYDVTKHHTRTPGLQAGVSLDLPIARYWGLEFVLIGQVNREHSMLFLELNSPLGLVRGRRHPPKQWMY